MSSIELRLKLLKSALGQHEKSKDGINFAFRCPSCNPRDSSKKKLVIKVDSGKFHCWVCDFKGATPVKIFKKYYPDKLHAAIEQYGKKYAKISTNNQDEEIPEVKLPRGFIFLALNMNHKDPDVTAVIKYALSRGLVVSDFWKFKLGTCTTGRYRRRLIIPSHDSEGELNYYVARAIDENPRKYINAKVSKKNIIFNEIYLDWSKEITIVEGPMDLVKSGENSTCILGSSLNESYLLFKKLVKNQTPVLLALDPDIIEKSHNIAKRLDEYGVNVKMIDITGYSDVGEMPQGKFQELKLKAFNWISQQRLLCKINRIKSGSIF